MKKILFINACPRGEESRTLLLAKDALSRESGDLREVTLDGLGLLPLDGERLKKRETLLSEGRLDDDFFALANEFATADVIYIATPFWDLGFPALLKIYIENIAVAGITFRYDAGRPIGLCSAERLVFVTTSGGDILYDFGYAYIKALARGMFGIKATRCIRSTRLDELGLGAEDVIANSEQFS